MENAGISVEVGPPDQLDQAFQLDFESNAEVEAFEAEGLDFGLDGPYEEAEHVSTEEIPVESYAGFDHDLAGHLPDDAVAEPELDQVDPEAHPAIPDDTIAQATEATNNADDDAEAEVEYHDEIGYEDDDLLTAEANAELSTTEPDGAERALADTSSEDHPAHVPVTDLEELSHGNDASWDQDIDFEDHGESTEPHDPQHALDDADEEEAACQEEGNGPAVGGFDDEATHEQLAPDHRAVDLDKELDDLTRSLDEVPDIEVLYNQECYSLFGTSDDDPDSYFLSGVEKLDCPLSEFLSALRTVISDDITTTDELVIRFDPLDLEFGERSSEKFLSRSFREILDCHTTLGQVPGVSADPVLHLTVRRDSEEHFLELLANVAQVEGSSNSDEDSEMLENHEEGSRPDDLYDEQVQDETFEDGNLDEYHDEGGHAVADHEENAELEIPLSHDDVSGEQDDGVSGEQGDDVSGEQDQNNQFHATEPQPSETAEGEEHFDTPPAEELSHDIAEDRADEEQAWDEQVAEDDNETVPQYPEITLEETDELNHQPAEQQGDEIPEISNPRAVDGVVTPNDGASEHEAGSNDDDLILAFDDEPGLSSIHEGEDERGEDAITFDDLEIPNNDAEDVQESVTAETLNESVVGHSENRGHDTVAETASIHTSTTINGDEIDYDEDNTAHSTSTPANDDAQHLAAVSGDKDEIDWENDEDEYEQQPATENARVDYEESKEIPLTSPSVAGKRSRADETESLADETDYKRRRT